MTSPVVQAVRKDHIPSPQEIGLPPKFDRWRTNQDAAIHTMLTSSERVTALCCPTGSGKSPAYVAAALLSGVPTCIVTATRGLEDQLMRDFGPIGMVDLRGKSNYTCNLRSDYDCAAGQQANCPYWGSAACPYSKAEMMAATSNLVVTNYDKWMAPSRLRMGFQHIQQLVLDELHEAPDALARQLQVILHHREIEEILKIRFPEHPEAATTPTWKEWAGKAMPVVNQAMADALAQITVPNPKPTHVRLFHHMRNLSHRLMAVSSMGPRDWVVEEIEAGYQFDAVRPGRYAESTLFRRVPRILGVSATVRPKTLNMLGLPHGQFRFQEFASVFDPARSPVWYIPTMRVDQRADDLGMLWVLLDQILSKRRDRKGIVQTVSFLRQKEILERSRHRDRMLVNERGIPPTSIVEQFKRKPSSSGSILVSPSIGTGYDFPDQDCRFNFLCKIPFEPPSKILKAREADDPEYRNYRAMQAMVQAFGRDMRSAEDWSERFIGDEHWDWFLPKNAHLAPRAFHAMIRRSSTVPPPLEL